jgi:hypothetical protein
MCIRKTIFFLGVFPILDLITQTKTPIMNGFTAESTPGSPVLRLDHFAFLTEQNLKRTFRASLFDVTF